MPLEDLAIGEVRHHLRVVADAVLIPLLDAVEIVVYLLVRDTVSPTELGFVESPRVAFPLYHPENFGAALRPVVVLGRFVLRHSNL